MAQPGYVINNANGTLIACTSSFRTGAAAKCPATLMKRFFVWELEFSCNGTLNATTDDQVTADLSALSNAGAGSGSATSIIPTNNSADTAVTVGTINYATTEPTTYSNSFFRKAVNQRSGYTWQCQQGGEIYFPATASIGCGMRYLSGGNYTSTVLNRLNISEI